MTFALGSQISDAQTVVRTRAPPERRSSNDRVERINRTIKDTTVKRLYYDDHYQLRRALLRKSA